MKWTENHFQSNIFYKTFHYFMEIFDCNRFLLNNVTQMNSKILKLPFLRLKCCN